MTPTFRCEHCAHEWTDDMCPMGAIRCPECGSIRFEWTNFRVTRFDERQNERQENDCKA